ncbi:MAG: adenylate/guanylate cyclase domain-containing protein [Candidatus Velthaea sp.]
MTVDIRTPPPTGTITFLFTDIEGSTRLWEAHSGAMRDALALHDAVLHDAIEADGGTVFKTVGDAFCAAFSRAERALEAAIHIQQRLRDAAWPAETGRLHVRMALHTGTAVETSGDFFGPTVNRVARLMSLAYGDQILVSGATAELVRDAEIAGASLRNLGAHRLKDLTAAETTFQVVCDGLRADFPALASLDARPNNLPSQLSSFVGREEELATLRDLCAAHRLVTIVGPGGIGKTRLALQLCGELIDALSDGAWIVELARLTSLNVLAQTVADVLRIREEPRVPIEETLVRALERKQLTLLLDSAEYFLAETARFVKLVASRCPGVRILATTREPLHITGERVLRLDALRGAERLFLDRARDASPEVARNAALAVATEICRRLEGIPLAVELAAARTSVLSLEEVLARIEHRLTLLVSRDPTKEPRHRTLAATIAWSYDLLAAEEARALRALSIFTGSCSLAGFAAVAGLAEADGVDVLEDLVAKSLVTVDRGVSASRYALSDTVREYLLSLAATQSEADGLRAAHFRYYAAFCAHLRDRLGVEAQKAAFDAADAEIGNVRSAVEWGLDHEPAAAADAVANIARYWKLRGHLTEGRWWLRHVLATTALDPARRAMILRRAATFATEQDAYGEARELSQECLAIARQLGDVNGVAEATHNLAVIEQRCGNLDAARAGYADAVRDFRSAGNRYGEVIALINIVLIDLANDDLAAAQRCLASAVTSARELDDADVHAHLTSLEGTLAFHRGDFDDAARSYEAALDVKARIGNKFDVAEIHNSLALARIRQRRLGEALRSAREVVRMSLELDTISLAVYAFEAYAEILLVAGQPANAVPYIRMALRLRHDHSFHHRTGRSADDIAEDIRAALARDVVPSAAEDDDWRALALAEPPAIRA